MKLNKNLILVKVDEAQKQDDDGIFIQEEWITNPPTGVVEAVGDDVTFCKKGDRVFFERYSSIKYNDTMRLCREDAVFVNETSD